MKEKIQNIVLEIGRQLETYAPLMASTGYEISRVDIKLFLGLLPSVTPIISKVSNPDVDAIISFLKSGNNNLANLITNKEDLINQLQQVKDKVDMLREKIAEVETKVEGIIQTAEKIQSDFEKGDLNLLLQDPTYAELLKDAFKILSDHVKSPVLKKLLGFIANSTGKQPMNFRGYEIKEFSLDLGLMPSVAFSLIKM